MKSQEKLRVSYDKQVRAFEMAKAKKLKNIEERIEQIQTKILTLQDQLNTLQEHQAEMQQSSFRNFEDFCRRSAEQSSQSKRT